jgi:phosphatidylserine decarboxylase precursor
MIMPQRQKNVENLNKLLESNEHLKQALQISLQTAQEPGIQTLEEFYNFLDEILTQVPPESELMPSVRKFYFVISKSPDDMLRKDNAFNEWMNEFVISRGDFMDSTESVKTLDTFINDPKYKIDDYIKGPSGWLTYNQFLARQLKPGKRPIAGLCDDKIVVSPADSEFKGQWVIDENSTITAKGATYQANSLLDGSKYQHHFKNGIFTHSFLGIDDYHRYHVPVSGIIREVKKIRGGTWVNEERKPDGSLENIDDVGFQFTHTRGYIIIESAVGFVAVMPIGMGHISSVTLTAEEGAELVKGKEFGYFAFGGSDIIMLFEPNRIKLTAKQSTHYKYGEQIAIAI